MLKSFSRANFLISIFMVIIMILALSTATYAWFEANTVVNLTTISFGARTNARGGALYLGWNLTDKTYNLSFYAPEHEEDLIRPMMPVIEPVIGVTTYSQFIDNTWQTDSVTAMATGFTTGYEELNRDGTVTYIDYDDPATPYQCRESENAASQNFFYVINDESEDTQRITIDYAITGELKDKLCIAVFIDDIFMGILTNADAISYGNISSGALVADTATTASCIAGHPSVTDAEDTAIRFDLPARNRVTCRMLVWYDGVRIESDDSSLSATLSRLSFTGRLVTSVDQPLPDYWGRN